VGASVIAVHIQHLGAESLPAFLATSAAAIRNSSVRRAPLKCRFVVRCNRYTADGLSNAKPSFPHLSHYGWFAVARHHGHPVAGFRPGRTPAIMLSKCNWNRGINTNVRAGRSEFFNFFEPSSIRPVGPDDRKTLF
jgi:hypothetical protein